MVCFRAIEAISAPHAESPASRLLHFERETRIIWHRDILIRYLEACCHTTAAASYPDWFSGGRLEPDADYFFFRLGPEITFFTGKYVAVGADKIYFPSDGIGFRSRSSRRRSIPAPADLRRFLFELNVGKSIHLRLMISGCD